MVEFIPHFSRSYHRRRRRKWQFGDVQWIRREELVKVGGEGALLVRDGNCGSGRWWEELRGAPCPSAVLKDTVVLLVLVTVVGVVVVADYFFYEDCPAHGPSQ